MPGLPDAERIIHRMPPGTRDRLRVVAAVHGVSMSEWMRRLILAALDREEARWMPAEDQQ